MFCRKCQNLLEAESHFCPRCFTPVKRASLLRRIVDRFINWCGNRTGAIDRTHGFSHSGLVQIKKITRLETSHDITIVDRNTGEERKYSRLEDVPPEYRKLLQTSETSSIPTSHQQTITVRGADGVERTYSKLEDVPPDMRQLIERAMKK